MGELTSRFVGGSFTGLPVFNHCHLTNSGSLFLFSFIKGRAFFLRQQKKTKYNPIYVIKFTLFIFHFALLQHFYIFMYNIF